MIFEDVIKYLSNIVDTEGVRPLGKEQNHILISCPLAPWTHSGGQDRHPSFMIWLNEDKQTYYKCYSCSESGNLWNLFYDYGRHINNEAVQALALEVLKADTPTLSSRFARIGNKMRSKYDVITEEVVSSTIVPDHIINRYELAILNPLAKKYLESRKVDDLTALRFNLRWDENSFRVCFPVYDELGNCVGMVGRTIPPGDVEQRRYYNYFNFEAAKSLGGINFIQDYEYNRILVVEGYFDLINCWQWCLEQSILPVCTWKAKVSRQQLTRLQKFDKMILSGYDDDNAGQQGTQKLLQEGGQSGLLVKQLKLPKDKDMGELVKPEFLDSLQSIKSFKSQRYSNV